MKKKEKKQIILLGEGANQHTLYGDFVMEKEPKTDFAEIEVIKATLLQHEEPNGKFAEHNTLKVGVGNWVMGKQVEYNPFKREISRVWD